MTKRGKKPLGRPTKWNLDVQKKIVDALMGGSFLQPAAVYGGIDYSTLKKWMARGEAGEKPYVAFRAVILDAIAKREVGYVATITAEGKRDWRAASWMLTHRYAKRWAQEKTKVEVTGKDDEPIEVHHSDRFEEALKRIVGLTRHSKEDDSDER